MRLQKYLADAGFGARRKCEEFIAAGRVLVNGAVAKLGSNVSPGDIVLLDGKPVGGASFFVYIALNKPTGYASDRSNPRNPSVFELVRTPQRLHAIGRLDMDSSGLMLLTNDGELSYRLTHPKFEHEKEYRVAVRGTPDSQTLARWRTGVQLEDEDTPTRPCQVRVLGREHGEAMLQVIMREGRKRQIRRVAKALGHPVQSLMRVRIGPLCLGTLELGRWRALESFEINALRRSVAE
jgi:pseudouridine synthase